MERQAPSHDDKSEVQEIPADWFDIGQEVEVFSGGEWRDAIVLGIPEGNKFVRCSYNTSLGVTEASFKPRIDEIRMKAKQETEMNAKTKAAKAKPAKASKPRKPRAKKGNAAPKNGTMDLWGNADELVNDFNEGKVAGAKGIKRIEALSKSLGLDSFAREKNQVKTIKGVDGEIKKQGNSAKDQISDQVTVLAQALALKEGREKSLKAASKAPKTDPLSKASKVEALEVDLSALVLVKDPSHYLFDRRALRKHQDSTVKDYLAKLADGSRRGIKEAVKVVKENNRLLVLDGRGRKINGDEANRRLKRKGEAPIRVRVDVYPTETEADRQEVLKIMASLNEQRQADTPCNKGMKMANMLSQGIPMKEVCQLFPVKGKPISDQTVRRFIRLLDLEEEVQSAVDSGYVTIDRALKLRGKSAEDQLKILDELLKAYDERKGKRRPRGSVTAARRPNKQQAEGYRAKVTASSKNHSKKEFSVRDVTALIDFMAGEIDLKTFADQSVLGQVFQDDLSGDQGAERAENGAK